MKAKEKISALIDAYIELAQDHHYNDSQIIDSLSDIFDEDELKELGFGDFVFNYFHDGEEAQNPAPLVDISKIAYDLYMEDWVEQHTTPEMRLQSIREYHKYMQECRDAGDELCSYEEYLGEFGYNGALYVCYDEFCDEEYHDVGYVKSLLGGDEALLKRYFEDVDVAHEEPEDLSVVSEVLSAAESRCMNCAAHESAEFGHLLD